MLRILTLPTPFLIVAKMSLPKRSAPWSNPFFKKLTFRHSGVQSLRAQSLSARMPNN